MIPFLTFLFLAADIPSTSSVSSTHASYDGNALTLSGHVTLDHGLGKMCAEEAVLERQEGGKEFPFSLIHLHRDVVVSLTKDATLSCDLADLDFVALKGHLIAQEGGQVTYSDVLKSKKGTPSIFQLKSPKVDLEMAKLGHDGKKSDFDIHSIRAREGVLLECKNLFTLQADSAFYRKETGASKEFQGVISAYPKDKHTPCHLVHKEDVIDAESVDVDLTQSSLSFYRPKGILRSLLSSKTSKADLHFSADHLLWEHLKQNLLLKGNILIQEAGLGTLSAQGEVEILHDLKKEGRILKKISSRGKTQLKYGIEKKAQTLVSYGTLILDHEHLIARIESPKNTPLYYEEENVAAHADQASLEYSWIEGTFQPVSLTLRGNVRLFSKALDAKKRCALADRLAYSPSTHTLILSANPGNKVLLWDEEQAIKMSAPEIHITRDVTTGNDLVKGVGLVQLTLTGEEKEILKRHFSFYKEETP